MVFKRGHSPIKMQNDFGVDRGNKTEFKKLCQGYKAPPPPSHELLLSGENILEILKERYLAGRN